MKSLLIQAKILRYGGWLSMIKEYRYEEFPINRFEVDDYLYWFAECYGEQSAVFEAIEDLCQHHDKEIQSQAADKKWISYLNQFRKILCEKGFEKEVLEQDEVFEKKMGEILSSFNKYSKKTVLQTRLGHIPMAKRWEMDNIKEAEERGRQRAKKAKK